MLINDQYKYPNLDHMLYFVRTPSVKPDNGADVRSTRFTEQLWEDSYLKLRGCTVFGATRSSLELVQFEEILPRSGLDYRRDGAGPRPV